MHRSSMRTWLGALAVFAIAAVSLTGTGAAAGPSDTMPGTRQVFTSRNDGDANVRIPAWFESASAPQGLSGLITSAAVTTSAFEVTYHNFPANAQAAFQKALDIWSTIVVSSVPIKVDATWEPLTPCDPGGCVLGSAGATNYLRWTPTSSPPAPAGAQLNTWYPMALANAFAGSDQDTTNPDISASFNSTYPSWSFDLAGTPISGKIDFTSVVLHEVGHGLGFIGSMNNTSS